MSSLDDWPADAPMPWWNQSSATEPEAEQNGLDISGIDDKKRSMSSLSPSPSRPPYRIRTGSDEWLRINYDTGAATTAFPL
eukprot:5405039-Pyramimonas_sp.AAC.1